MCVGVWGGGGGHYLGSEAGVTVVFTYLPQMATSSVSVLCNDIVDAVEEISSQVCHALLSGLDRTQLEQIVTVLQVRCVHVACDSSGLCLPWCLYACQWLLHLCVSCFSNYKTCYQYVVKIVGLLLQRNATPSLPQLKRQPHHRYLHPINAVQEAHNVNAWVADRVKLVCD